MTKRWLVTFTRKTQPMAGSHRFAFLFRKSSAFLKPNVPVMASRRPWDFSPFYLGRLLNLMPKVMPVLFAIPDGDALLAQSLFGLSSIRRHTFTIASLAVSKS